MSPRLRPFGFPAFFCALAMTASMAFAQSEWKEIPVGYNMPKSVMAVTSLSTMAVAMAPPTPAKPATKKYYGQERDPYHKWEIEFHGGGFFTLGSVDGQGFTPPTGTPFTTVGGTPSLIVSSFLFGDGANLANNVAAAGVGGGPIVPLDAILDRSLGTRNSGPSIGLRLSRDLGSHFTGELNFDWSMTPVEIRDSSLLQVEATRASFGTFFPMSTKEGAISSIKRSAGNQFFYTGVLNANLTTEGKVIPYLSFGGGAVTDIGPKPHAGIFAQYSFTPGTMLQQGTDLVNLEAGTKNRTNWVAILGIGMKYYATPRWGLRFDLRDHVTSNSIDTFLSASPSTNLITPGETISFLTTPDIQFSNDPTAPGGGPSSLSGPAIHRVRTFKGSGITNQLNFSAGVLYRF